MLLRSVSSSSNQILSTSNTLAKKILQMKLTYQQLEEKAEPRRQGGMEDGGFCGYEIFYLAIQHKPSSPELYFVDGTTSEH